MKVQIPLIISFIVGIALIIAIFVPHDPFHSMNETFSIYFDLIAVFAFILGGGNLLKVHGDKIYRRAKDWKYSIVTAAGFIIMLVVGALKLGGPPGFTGDVTAEGSWFKFMYDSLFVPLQSTMFSLLAFFVASASYRAFRAKTREATLLLIAAFIILVGRTPLGHYLTGWLPPPLQFLHIPNVSNWILSFPNMAGQRAIMIGISLGIIATSLKMILGIERSYLGGESK
ncbi:MAG: hypothetical protein QME66_07080 [Candidatus Eisenbacteria bacterium]|nr:hypothetical protein [Candidatus Eisenbacteria bacterium]